MLQEYEVMFWDSIYEGKWSNLPEGLEDEVCKILGLEKVTNKILSNYTGSRHSVSQGVYLSVCPSVRTYVTA
jgi:hypothetical protein